VPLTGCVVDDQERERRTAVRGVESLDQRSQSAVEQQVVGVEEDDVRSSDSVQCGIACGSGGAAHGQAYELGVGQRGQRHPGSVVDHDQLEGHGLAPDAVHRLQETLARVRIPRRDHDGDARRRGA